MRHRFSSPTRDQGHVSRKPLSTRNLPMRRCFVLTLLACTLPALAFAGKPPGTRSPASTCRARLTRVASTSTTRARSLATSVDAAGRPRLRLERGRFHTDRCAGRGLDASRGINDAGAIVGRYDDALTSARVTASCLSGGNFTTVDVPGATFTVARGINLAGDIVGLYTDAAGKTHGFLLSGGQFTTIDYPNSTFTACSGINNNGQIVGEYTRRRREHARVPPERRPVHRDRTYPRRPTPGL